MSVHSARSRGGFRFADNGCDDEDDDMLENLVLYGLNGRAPAPDDEPICELCEQPVPEGQSSKHPKYGLKILDKACFNGLHCLERLCQKRAKLASQVKSCLRNDFVKFQAIGMSLVTTQGTNRTQKQRDDTVQFLVVMTRENSFKRRIRALLLSKDEAIAMWMMPPLQLSQADAQRKWFAELKAPKAHTEKENGILKLAVRKPTELILDETARSARQTVKAKTVGEAEGSRLRLAGAQKLPAEFMGMGVEACLDDEEVDEANK